MSLWLRFASAGKARAGKVKGYVLSGTDRITWRFKIGDLDDMLTGPAVLSDGRN